MVKPVNRRSEAAAEVAMFRQIIARARANPLWFCREVLQLKRLPTERRPDDPLYNPRLDWELDEWQIELIESAWDVFRKHTGNGKTVFNHEGKPQITVRACQGPGKTFGIAILAHLFGFCFSELVIAVVAPKKEHVKTRFFGEFNKIKARSLSSYQELLETNSEAVYWKGTDKTLHFLIAETGQQPENIQGLRRSVSLYLVDESSGVKENLFPVIEGNQAGSDLSVVVYIGNPTRNQGTFADSHLKEKLEGDYYRMHIGPDKSRRIKQSWIARMVRKYGAQSPVVRVRCYGEFAANSENQLIALEWLAAARNREGIDPIIGDGSLPRIRVSVDCGGGGDNETVCTAAKHFQSYKLGLKQTRHSFPMHTATQDTADAAEKLFFMFDGTRGKDDFVVDALGIGLGVAGELVKRKHSVVFYQGGASSDDTLRWRCRRVQSYLVLRNELRDGNWVFLESFFDEAGDWDDFDAQLCSILVKPGNERVEDLLTKEEMRTMGIDSPDMADSLAMQCATQRPQAMPHAPGDPQNAAKQTEVFESSLFEGYAA